MICLESDSVVVESESQNGGRESMNQTNVGEEACLEWWEEVRGVMKDTKLDSLRI